MAGVRTRGWAVSDEEREEGLLSVGAPIRRNDEVIAAINAQSQTARMSLGEMQEKILPRLLETAAAISADLAYASH